MRRSAIVFALVAWWLSGAMSALAATPATPTTGSKAGGEVALRLERGSIAQNQLVAVGRDLIIDGEAQGDVAAIDGSVEITGTVGGDVAVLGGNARLSPTAQVLGDLFVLGGEITVAPGARVSGRSVSYRNASAAWITLLEGPSLGLNASSPLVLGAKLALLAAWSALLVFLFATAGRQILSTSESVQIEPIRDFFTGLVGILAFVLTALFFSAFAGNLVGVPLLVLVVFAALALKLWGMIAVFHAAGSWLAGRFSRRLRPINAATIGLVVLGLLKFVPYLGLWVWTIATFVGVGATLATKFGRREPWFEGV